MVSLTEYAGSGQKDEPHEAIAGKHLADTAGAFEHIAHDNLIYSQQHHTNKVNDADCSQKTIQSLFQCFHDCSPSLSAVTSA